MRFPGGKAKALTFSYDDGMKPDIKLMDIFDRHGLKGTFNLNTNRFPTEDMVNPAPYYSRRMTKERTRELFANSGHEVAVHTLTHPFLEQLPANMATYEVLCDRKNLEDMFQTVVRGMAYPYGTFSDEVVEVLKACGIAYARTTKTTGDFSLPKDWLRLPATCHHKDKKLMELGNKFVNETPNRTSWLFYVWGHSFEFDDNNNWEIMENFAELVAFKEDIWYATNIEIYDYCKAYEALLFSVDGSKVYNPTAIEVFFADSSLGKTYSVKPGETICIR